LLFPIDWVEPFGLVMIEAMACGTPVVAFRRGSVPEVIDPGATGFIVENIEDSLVALEKIQNFDRSRCRRIFEKRFSAARMAADYMKIYERLITKDLGMTKIPAAAKASRARVSVPCNGKGIPAETLHGKPQ
jgi:glycosyltransferase involved in cell wall biosynthesis